MNARMHSAQPSRWVSRRRRRWGEEAPAEVVVQGGAGVAALGAVRVARAGSGGGVDGASTGDGPPGQTGQTGQRGAKPGGVRLACPRHRHANCPLCAGVSGLAGRAIVPLRTGSCANAGVIPGGPGGNPPARPTPPGRVRYQPSSPSSSWKVPVGPSLPMTAIRTMFRALTSTGRPWGLSCPPPRSGLSGGRGGVFHDGFSRIGVHFGRRGSGAIHQWDRLRDASNHGAAPVPRTGATMRNVSPGNRASPGRGAQNTRNTAKNTG